MVFFEVGEFGVGSPYLLFFSGILLCLWIVFVFLFFKRYGAKKTFRFFVPMMIASLFLEAAAVASGRYMYPGYLLYLSVIGGAVPVIILFGWSVNLFLFLKMGEHAVSFFYKKLNYVRIVFISVVAGLFGVCLDLLEDPIAHHNNWWVWTQQGISVSFFGVPVSNFLDWFLILFFMSLATQLIDQSKLSENRKLLLSVISVSYIGAMIYVTHTALVLLFPILGG